MPGKGQSKLAENSTQILEQYLYTRKSVLCLLFGLQSSNITMQPPVGCPVSNSDDYGFYVRSQSA